LHAGLEGSSIPERDRGRLVEVFKTELHNELRRIKQISDSSQHFQREHIVRAVDDSFSKAIREIQGTRRISPGQAKAISSNIQRIARDVAFRAPGVPPTIDASIITPEIKDQASAANVARMRLVVKEEGLEWDVVERPDGTTSRTLSPE